MNKFETLEPAKSTKPATLNLAFSIIHDDGVR